MTILSIKYSIIAFHELNVLLLCNRYSYCRLGQILYLYQLITNFIPRTIKSATVLLLGLIQPNSTHYI